MTPVPALTRRPYAHIGFTLIELMIVVAIIAIILSLALPVYTDYTTRSKVGEALSIGAAAKTAVATSCIEDPTIDPVNNSKAGYSFSPSTYVFSVTSSGSCMDPVITLVTQNTGVAPAIVLTLTGNLNAGRARIDWLCTSNTSNNNVPTECRT